MKPVVDIGVACRPEQSPDWWGPVWTLLLQEERNGVIEIGRVITSKSAMPDHSKNNSIAGTKRRFDLTDANRIKISNSFLNGKADWFFQIDDDTVPSNLAISTLLGHGHPFIAGIYFYPNPPYNPIAYIREEEGTYQPISDFPKGALIQVDSVGMGCTLIHRSVFEKIMKEHTVFERQNGSIYPVHNSQIKGHTTNNFKVQKPFVRNGVYHEAVTVQNESDSRVFPFYLMEHGRTEDHFFCELAANVGIRPYLDTTVSCAHYKNKPTTINDYLTYLRKEKME